MPRSAQYWIDKLKLIAHPEGGYYRETYRSELLISREALPPQFTGPRLVSTAIYFLLEGRTFCLPSAALRRVVALSYR